MARPKITKYDFCKWLASNAEHFYRATRMHSADYAVARCLSVRLSVCPSVSSQVK